MATQTEVLAGQVEQGFGQHPDAEIYRSQPGLGLILGARVLAGFAPKMSTSCGVRRGPGAGPPPAAGRAGWDHDLA
jgi:hypothetical protein